MTDQIIKLPDIGEGITEAELTEWLVAVGDVVHEDDILAVVMTDKAAVEIPAPADGIVTWLSGEAGDSFAVGSELVSLSTDGATSGPALDATRQVTSEANIETKVDVPEPPRHAEKPTDFEPKQGAGSSKAGLGEKPAAAPWVRMRARELGIKLADVAGSGLGGRILYDDLEDYLSAPRASVKTRKSDVTDIKVTGLRRVIAARMQAAKTQAPHFSIIEEVDVTELERTRAALNQADANGRGKLTVLPFVAAAIVLAVAEQPGLNAHFYADEGVIRQFSAVHVGIATQTDRGLMVPVLHHAGAMTLWDTAARVRELSNAARSGTVGKSDLEGSTITISSLGALGAVATTPILNLPEVAVVGVNKIAVRPIWDGQAFQPRTMMNLSASFDHRVVDGWDGAVFVARLKALLETPALLFIGD